MSKQAPDYGLDAPRAVRAIFIVGLAGAVVRFYAEELRKSDMTDVEISGLSFWTFPPARTVTARKPLQPI